jgi:hypothetical protein
MTGLKRRAWQLAALHWLIFSSTVALGQQPSSNRALSVGTVDGVVTDTNLVPVTGVTVSIMGANVKVVTGSNGHFRLEKVPLGTYHLLVRRIGFEVMLAPVQVSSGDTSRLSFSLLPVTPTLDTVMVRGQKLTLPMQEFEARRKLGFGQFMTQMEIDKRNVEGLQDLLAMFNGVKMLTNSWPVSRRMDGIRTCPYEVYIDGVKLPYPTAPTTPTTPSKGVRMPRAASPTYPNASTFSIDDIAFPKELAGIEVYNGPAETPPQYKATSGGGFCGVILLWTRVGS